MKQTKPSVYLPPTTPAWLLNLLGFVLLAVALWVSLPMWIAWLGFRSASDWGGEYMLALYIAVPCILLSAVIFMMTTPGGRGDRFCPLRPWPCR